MQLGISTACFYPVETERALSLVGENGVKHTEIFFNANCELCPEFVSELRGIALRYGISVLSVHPTMSLAESFMLFSNYDRRLREGLDNYRRYGEIAARLGAKYVIMHGGKPNGILDDDRYCERFLQISDAVAESGAVLLQENVAKYRAQNIAFLKNMVRNLGERAAFCMDVKQCIRGGCTPGELLEAVGANVRHLHISDHTPEADCLLPGNGGYDFSDLFARLRRLGYTGGAVIEVYRGAYREPDEVFASLRHLKGLISASDRNEK